MNEHDQSDHTPEQADTPKQQASGFSPRAKSNVKKVIFTGAVIGAIFAADRYDATERMGDLVEYSVNSTVSGVSRAYEGTILGLSRIGSVNNRMNIANELFRDLPEETKMNAMVGMYRRMDESERIEFMAGSLSGKYGSMGEQMRSIAIDAMISTANEGQLAAMVNKGYDAMDMERKYDSVSTKVKDFSQFKKKEIIGVAYGGLDDKERGALLDEAVKEMSPGQRKDAIKMTFGKLPQDAQYGLLLETVVGMPNDVIKNIYAEGTKNFSGKDYVDTVAIMTHLSGKRYDNHSEIAKTVLAMSANNLADKLDKYINKHFK